MIKKNIKKISRYFLSVIFLTVLFLGLIKILDNIDYSKPVSLAAWTDGNSTLRGYAWSENIGWVSFSSFDTGSPINYGVDIAPSGDLSGYAWSENIGWISFESADVSGCPSGTCQPKFDSAANKLSGWAKALIGGEWIHLAGANYAATLNADTCEFENWAWSDTDVGWLSFNSKNTGGYLDTTISNTDTSFSSGTFLNTQTSSGNVLLAKVSYRDIVMGTSNLISYWKMDNNWDDSLNVNNGTGYGGVNRFSTNNHDGGYSGNFDGIDDYVLTNYAPSSNIGSIEAWIYYPSTDTNRTIAQVNDKFLFYISNTGRVYFVGTANSLGTSGRSTNSNLTPGGGFHHIVGTFDGTSASLYVDGFLRGRQLSNNVGATALLFSNQTAIGSGRSGYSNFRGYIDEVAVYDRVLSSTEINEHRNGSTDYYSSGTYTSLVKNFGLTPKFDRVTYNTQKPFGTSLTIDMRAGNTSTPDASWTSWQNNILSGSSLSVFDGNRYIQYRANFSTTDLNRTAFLQDITINYFQRTPLYSVKTRSCPPYIESGSLSLAQPDYCSSTAINFSWIYKDKNSLDASFYQVQADDNSDFSSPVADSGQQVPVNKSSGSTQNYQFPVGSGLPWTGANPTYYWRVKVWNEDGLASNWQQYSDTFSTPKHPYPSVDATYSPEKPSVGEIIKFMDNSTYVFPDGGSLISRLWTFGTANPDRVDIAPYSAPNGDGVSVTSAASAVEMKVYDNDSPANGANLNVSLQSKNDNNDTEGFIYECSKSLSAINAKLPLPEFKEIKPQ